MIRRYFEMLVAGGYPDASGKMKQFASWFTHGVEGGAKLRKAIYGSKSAEQIVDAVNLFFSRPMVESDRLPDVSGEGEYAEHCG